MHRVRLLALAAVCALATSLFATAGASASTPQELRTSCEQFRMGSTYITSLKQRSTKCSTAKKVARKFTQCRKDNGGANGRCNQTVAKYDCNEGKREGNNFQYNAKVKCARGGNKVVFTYTQQT